MRLFGLFKKNTQSSPHSEPVQSPAPIPLRAAPDYVPVPVNDTPLDAEVSRQWLAFQQQNRSATWAQFIKHVTAEIAGIQAEIATKRAKLKEAPPPEYVP